MSSNILDEFLASTKGAVKSDTYKKDDQSISTLLGNEALQGDPGFVFEYEKQARLSASPLPEAQALSNLIAMGSDDAMAIRLLQSGINFVSGCLTQEFKGLSSVATNTVDLVRESICGHKFEYISGDEVLAKFKPFIELKPKYSPGNGLDSKSDALGRILLEVTGFGVIQRKLVSSVYTSSVTYSYPNDDILPSNIKEFFKFVEKQPHDQAEIAVGFSIVLLISLGTETSYYMYIREDGSNFVTGLNDFPIVNSASQLKELPRIEVTADYINSLKLFKDVKKLSKEAEPLSKELISLHSQKIGSVATTTTVNIFKEVSDYAKEFVKNSNNFPAVTVLSPLYRKYLLSDALSRKPSCNPFSFGSDETKDAICGYIKFVDISRDLIDDISRSPNVDTRLLTQSRDQAVNINPDSGIQMHKAELRALSDRKNAAEKAMRVASSMVNSLKGATETNTWLVRHGVVRKVWSFKEATDITNYGDWLTGWSDNWLNVRYTKKNRGVLSCSAIRNKLNRRANIIENGLTDSNPISPEARAEQLYNKYKALVERMINMLRELQMQVYFFQDLPFSVRNSFRSFVESVVGSFARYSRAQSPIKPVDAARMMYLYRVLIIDLPEEASASLYSQFMVDSSKYGAGFYFDDKSGGTPPIRTYTLLDVALNLLGEMKASYVSPDTDPYISVPLDSNPFFMDSTRYEMDRFSGATLPQNLASGRGLSLNLVEPKIDPITPSKTNVTEEPIYKFGDKSEGLKAVQNNLKLFLEKTGATLQGVAIQGKTQISGKEIFNVDGTFGVDTRNAVGFFQNYVGLDKTYYVDKTTLLALNKYIADNK